MEHVHTHTNTHTHKLTHTNSHILKHTKKHAHPHTHASKHAHINRNAFDCECGMCAMHGITKLGDYVSSFYNILTTSKNSHNCF